MSCVGDDRVLQSGALAGVSVNRKIRRSLGRGIDGERVSSSASKPARPLLVASGRFIEQEVIGEGGMSVVVRAFDSELERDVALKVLASESDDDEMGAALLFEEARVMSLLEHPNIVPLYEFGADDDGRPFLCMRLVHGETLEQTLDWAGPARLGTHFLATLLEVLESACEAVAFAHARGIVHCDLKPSNLMTNHLGQVYVLDWGVARRFGRRQGTGGTIASAIASATAGMMVGTPPYMAPEQLWDKTTSSTSGPTSSPWARRFTKSWQADPRTIPMACRT